MTPTWLQSAPENVDRVLHGLPVSRGVLSDAGEDSPEAYEEHFRTWTMFRFVDSQVASTDSFHSYTTSNLRMSPPPSPASGPLRYVAEGEPVGDTPRDAHLPGRLRELHARDLFQETICDYVASFYPGLTYFLTRLPHEALSAADYMRWTCPQCGYIFDPLDIGIDEHAALVNIAPHLQVIDEDSGSISIEASDKDTLLRYLDHFAYLHVDHSHLREIGIYLSYPDLEAVHPAPASWYFANDRPTMAGSAFSEELPSDVEHELKQVQQDFDRREVTLRSRLHTHFTNKARRAFNRALHRLSVHLTIWRYNRRIERRELVLGLLDAGRSIIDVGRALVSRLHDEERDIVQRSRLREYYAYKRAYCDVGSAGSASGEGYVGTG